MMTATEISAITVNGRRVRTVDRVYPVDVARADENQGIPRRGHALPPRFAYAIGRLGAAVVVSLRGELVGSAVTQLADVLDDLICGQGNLTVVVDLREISEVDPTARVVFSAAACWAGSRGGTFRLYKPSPSVRSALDVTGEGVPEEGVPGEDITEEDGTGQTEAVELVGGRP